MGQEPSVLKAMSQASFLEIVEGLASPWHFEAIFVDFETLDFRIERSRRQP